MEKRGVFGCVIPAAAMICLILDGKTALYGAREGIDICIRTVIPSLFPFIFFSILLDQALSGRTISFLGPFSRIIGFPDGCSNLIISSFIGGYPIGAQAVAHAYREGRIDKATAEKMLAYSNNAGPAFIFGMLGQMFPGTKAPWSLWGIHILSAMMIGSIVSPGVHPSRHMISKSKNSAEAMARAVKVTGTVCGWVILFRIVITFLEKWILGGTPPELDVICTGLLELTNGCCALLSIEDPDIRFIICSGLIALGGSCVTMQTASVTHGLRIRYYLLGKMAQCILSLIISASLIFRMWTVPLFLGAVLAAWRIKQKNNYGNPAAIHV